MSEADKRQLKIKAGTVKRLHKELGMYVDEQEKEAAKVQKLRDEGADPHDIKYAENILNESAAMIPDTRRRLETAVKELQALVEEFSSSLAGSEELGLAEAALQSAAS